MFFYFYNEENGKYLTWINGFDSYDLNDGKGNITFNLASGSPSDNSSMQERLEVLGGFQLHNIESAGANKTYKVTKIYLEK